MTVEFNQLFTHHLRSGGQNLEIWAPEYRTEPGLNLQKVEKNSEGHWELTVTSQKYARCVHIQGLAEGCSEGDPVMVSEAFFDMRAGESKILTLQTKSSLDVQALSLAHWLRDWS